MDKRDVAEAMEALASQGQSTGTKAIRVYLGHGSYGMILSMLILAPIITTILRGLLEFRPQLLTSACLSIELWVLMSVHTGRRSARWLWILPPMLAVAINWHGGWVQLLVMPVVILGAQSISTRARGCGAVSHLPPHTLALAGLACAAALFLNPYSVSLMTFPLQMEAAWIRAIGPEWWSAWTRRGWWLVGGGLFVPIQPVFFLYAALLGSVLVKTIAHTFWRDLVPIAVMSFWLALCTWHLRTVADAMLLTSPFVAAALGSLPRVDSTRGWWRGARWPVWVSIGLLSGLTAIGLWGAWQWRDWRWTRGEPLCVEAAVERLGRTVRVLGDPRHEWLLYRLPDRVTVNLFWEYASGQQASTEFDAIWRGRANLGPYLDRYRVHLILLNTGAFRNVPLLTSMGWVMIHLDDRFFLMVPRRPDMDALIEQEGYRLIRPWENAPVTPANATAVLAETERALSHCPDGASFVHAYRANALYLLGRAREAFEAQLKVPERPVIE
jgi:hypothetical protein